MKKIMVAIFLSCMLLFGLTACQSGGASSDSSSSTQSSTFQSVSDRQGAASSSDGDSATQSPDIYLTLVNRQNKLPDNWLNQIDLVFAYNSLGEEVQVEKVALEHFEALRDEALEAGVDIELDSVYRSVDEQQEIWNEWLDEYGEDYCNQYLAVPGFSEHHTGLAIDVFIIKDKKIIRDNDDMIADTEDFAIVHQLLAKHGFILRYMQGKEDVTGYSYEPWHFRYVGPEAAETIASRGITLEEYLEIAK